MGQGLGLILFFVIAVLVLLIYRYRAQLDVVRKERSALLHIAFWHRARVAKLEGQQKP